MTPAFGVRTAAAVRARHGWDAAALRDGARNEVAAAAAALTHARVAWPPRLARRRRRRKLAPATAGEMPRSRRLLAPRKVVLATPAATLDGGARRTWSTARSSGEGCHRAAMAGDHLASPKSPPSLRERRNRGDGEK